MYFQLSEFIITQPLKPKNLNLWRDGREAEGVGLLNRYMVEKLYRGFESPSLRQNKKASLVRDWLFCFGEDSWMRTWVRQMTQKRLIIVSSNLDAKVSEANDSAPKTFLGVSKSAYRICESQ